MRRGELVHVGPVIGDALSKIADVWEKRHGHPAPDHVRDLIDGDTSEFPSFLHECPDCGGNMVVLGDRIDGVLMFHAECETCRRKGALRRSRENAVSDWNAAA